MSGLSALEPDGRVLPRISLVGAVRDSKVLIPAPIKKEASERAY